MNSSHKDFIAFFGATGGTTASALALALKDGYSASALARTPSKLRSLMENEHGVPPATLDSQLTIIQGSARDIEAVKQTLAPSGKPPASMVISGLGSYPTTSLKPPFIVNTDATLCGDAVTILLDALRHLRRQGQLSEHQKPLVYVGSTTGLSAKRDVPYALAPLYHVLLASAHRDKKVMETALAEASRETGPAAPISGFVIGRPSLLVDGPPLGMARVRVGSERHPSAAPGAATEPDTPPAIGYSIRRGDVGAWVFENVIKGGGVGNSWAGKCVSMTY